MAISWDFTAAAKAQQAGQAAAARDGANLQRSISQGMAAGQRAARAKQLEKERQDRAAQAQQLIVDKFNKETKDTFDIPAGPDGKDYANVNEIFDYSANQLVKTYTSIYNDKDMDTDKRALALKKLTNQIPLLKNAQQQLNLNIGTYSQAVLDGDVSKAMEPKWQEMYSELADGSFKGGIDYIDGETRLMGKTSSGHEVNLPLRDFQKNLPSVETSAGTMTDSLDVQRDVYKKQYAEYLKNPKKNPLPVFNLKDRAAEIATTIGGLNGDGLKRYGMDVMNYTEEEIDEMVHKYMTGEVSRPTMPEKTLNSLTKEQQIRFGNDNAKMAQPEAMAYVVDDLAMEMAQIQETYLNQTPYLKPYNPPAAAPTYDQNLLVDIANNLGENFDPKNIGFENNAADFNIESGIKVTPNGKTIIEISQTAIPFPEEKNKNGSIKNPAEPKEEAAKRNKTTTFDLTKKSDVLELMQKEFGYKAGQGGFAPGTKRDNAIINNLDRMADQVVAKYVEKQERFGKQKLRDSTEGGLTIDQLQEQIEFKKSKGDQSWRMDEITLKNKQKAQDLLNKYKS